MGCGTSAPVPYNPPQGRHNTSEDENDQYSVKLSDYPQTKESDPILSTFNQMVPQMQQKKEARKTNVEMDEVELPGTPAEPSEQEPDESPRERAAVEAATAVVNEIKRQIGAAREISADQTISDRKRELAGKSADELELIVPHVVAVTREAFTKPQAQVR